MKQNIVVGNLIRLRDPIIELVDGGSRLTLNIVCEYRPNVMVSHL